jgi:hypothetical protein
MRALLLSACLVLCGVTLQAQTTSHASHHTSKLTWGPAPDAFPKGAQMAVVSGDPSKAGRFTVQLSLPDGYQVAPHFHPTDETVTVKKGTFLFGMGDTVDLSKAKKMKPGAKGTVKAQQHHYAAAKGATVVQVTAMGPFAITYVNPADDPRNGGESKQ